ncbi:hypothetical protein [Leptospira weilii]|uniref:hypothetical protein n=1 Tax=Leptospira weilii TaxID=28184 RepID=UPI00036F1D14|nr:hypothetical protein [Leptospira weilii]OMI18158.1 hypothetical protein BUQ74_06470 [Leptospira weilii serovar Heyan]
MPIHREAFAELMAPLGSRFTEFREKHFRQNGAPSELENRGLDAKFAFTTKQENQQKKHNEKNAA